MVNSKPYLNSPLAHQVAFRHFVFGFVPMKGKQ